jgi:adenylate kinase family enzyme
LIEYYEENGLLKNVKAEGGIEEIYAEIKKILK